MFSRTVLRATSKIPPFEPAGVLRAKRRCRPGVHASRRTRHLGLEDPAFRDFQVGVLGNTLGACKPQTDLSKLDASRVNLWSIDILFTDINLPDGPEEIDGLQLARISHTR